MSNSVAQMPPPPVQLPVPEPEPKPLTPRAEELSSLFGLGYTNYPRNRWTFLASFVGEIVVLTIIVFSGIWAASNKEVKQQVTVIVGDLSEYVLPHSKTNSGGGGGGGDRSQIKAAKGALPKFDKVQIAPPSAVIEKEPLLPVPPTVVIPNNIKLPQIGPLGDPIAKAGPASNGTGSGGGIGSGSGGGVGAGRGDGVGKGYGGGIGGGPYRVGGGVSAPSVTYQLDPEFSEEARKAKYQGTVALGLTVGRDGRAHDIHVVRSLGLGLDEKAIEAVKLWKFEPGKKDGQAVDVLVSVEVNFRLY